MNCEDCIHEKVCEGYSNCEEVGLCEPKRPHGEWIFHKYDKNYECSNCHVKLDKTQIYTEKRFENALWAKMKIYSFCPNCGADMREGDRNEHV